MRGAARHYLRDVDAVVPGDVLVAQPPGYAEAEPRPALHELDLDGFLLGGRLRYVQRVRFNCSAFHFLQW